MAGLSPELSLVLGVQRAYYVVLRMQRYEGFPGDAGGRSSISRQCPTRVMYHSECDTLGRAARCTVGMRAVASSEWTTFGAMALRYFCGTIFRTRKKRGFLDRIW